MDVDESGIHKYDEYVRGAVREVITVETKIKPTNKGFALLSKLGWVEGQPVGLSGEGKRHSDNAMKSMVNDTRPRGSHTISYEVGFNWPWQVEPGFPHDRRNCFSKARTGLGTPTARK